MPVVTEHVVKTERHCTSYIACGPEDGTPLIFLHGWPELAISWRHQLPIFGGLGFRAIAPDMRGYGRSTVHPAKADYAIAEIEKDMIELLVTLGAEKAIWIGHDWGGSVVWSIAQHHPSRCHGVASLCVPYIPGGWTVRELLKLADRSLYPEDQYPHAQWDYWLFHNEQFDLSAAGLDADISATVRAIFRRGEPSLKGTSQHSASISRIGGWFGPDGAPAPELPRDEQVISAEAQSQYEAALIRNGFAAANSWYVNDEANARHAQAARDNWRLSMPVLFLHGAYDYYCTTLDTDLANPMREYCEDLTEAVVESGHWMAQEKPVAVNAAIMAWIAQAIPSAGTEFTSVAPRPIG